MQDSPYHIHKNQRNGLIVMAILLFVLLCVKYASNYYRPNGDTVLADSLFISQVDSIEAKLLFDSTSKVIIHSKRGMEGISKTKADSVVKKKPVRSRFNDILPQDKW